MNRADESLSLQEPFSVSIEKFRSKRRTSKTPKPDGKVAEKKVNLAGAPLAAMPLKSRRCWPVEPKRRSIIPTGFLKLSGMAIEPLPNSDAGLSAFTLATISP